MNIWLVSMECASIVEAGGIKDVTLALARHLTCLGHNVTLFIPHFNCVSFNNLIDIQNDFASSSAFLCGKSHNFTYTRARFKEFNARVILINHLCYYEKHAVYVYTKEEEAANPLLQCGTGHVDFHFLDCLLSRAVANYISIDDKVDVVHSQDASCALTPAYIALKRQEEGLFAATKCLTTIHNAGPAYHHNFFNLEEAAHYTMLPAEWLASCQNSGRVEPFLLAARFGTLSTVSSFYAKELCDISNKEDTEGLSIEFYKKGIRIEAITNGVEISDFDTKYPKKSLLPYKYSLTKDKIQGKEKVRLFFVHLTNLEKNTAEVGSNPAEVGDKKETVRAININITEEDKECYTKNLTQYGSITLDYKSDSVFFSYHGRLATQKGAMLLADTFTSFLEKHKNAYLLIMGQGEHPLEYALKTLATRFNGQVVFYNGYNEAMARLLIAAGDYCVLPSFFEPCCQEDFIASLYGVIPVAHKTGGLNKIISGKTGFLYSPNDKEHLTNALEEAVTFKLQKPISFFKMQQVAYKYVVNNYSWEKVIEEGYIKLYKKILQSS